VQTDRFEPGSSALCDGIENECEKRSGERRAKPRSAMDVRRRGGVAANM
jgi:hypothetical protein